MTRVRVLVLGIALATAAALVVAAQEGMSKSDRALYKQMLGDLHKDIRDNYYDRGFRGIDLDRLFADAGTKVAAAQTTMEAVDAIAGVFFAFADSHTRFIPPQRAVSVDYGWSMAAVGDRVLVQRVDAGSDAAKAGLSPGDEVLGLNRFRPNRENLSQIEHYYRVVRPQVQQRLNVRKPDGSLRTIDVKSRTDRRPVIQITDAIEDAIEAQRKDADTTRKVEPGILVWRMTAFRDGEDASSFISKAREAKGLVLDLRANPGGQLEGLKALVGSMFDRDVHVITRVGRKGERRDVAKAKGKPFLGRMVVLVDSRSASAAECFARVVQLEDRGKVIGDRTAGRVMVSEIFAHDFGVGAQTTYAASVTVFDSRMSDGAGLEKVGVTPDEILLPTAADLAAGRDPVLARAVAVLGGNLSAEEAGRLLPPR
jgi:C-terminal processing protease CtpA/Prc